MTKNVSELVKGHLTIFLDPEEGVDNVGHHMQILGMSKFQYQLKHIRLLK